MKLSADCEVSEQEVGSQTPELLLLYTKTIFCTYIWIVAILTNGEGELGQILASAQASGSQQ